MDEELRSEVDRQLGYFDAAMALVDSGIFKVQNQDTGGLVTYVPKWEQRRLYKLIRQDIAAGRPAFVIILKARQLGFSTAIAMLFLALALVRGGIDVLVAAHEDKSQRRIWKIYKTAWRHLPEEHRTVLEGGKRVERARYDSKKELEFKDSETHIGVYVAGKGELGRSGASHCAHLSEFARWKNQTEDLNSVMSAVPNAPGSIAVIETTANGWGDHFHGMWQEAEAADREGRRHPWQPYFLPWWKEKRYQSRLTRNKTGGHVDWEMDDDERDLDRTVRERYEVGLSKTQLQWRRDKIAGDCGGDVRLFDQEYPTTPEHAFRASGAKVFDAEGMAWVRQKYLAEPEGLFSIMAGLAGGWHLRPEQEGNLRLYRQAGDGRYILGADPTHGLSDESDPAAIQVFDVESLEQVAVWEGVIGQHEFGDVIVGLARMFNNAFAVIESNIGTATCERVYNGLRYTNIAFHEVPGKSFDAPRQEFGFKTTPANRTVAINLGKRLISERILRLYDAATIEEFEAFREVKTPSGKYKARAPSGKQDNLVMAALIALYIGDRKYGWTSGEGLMRRREAPMPVLPEPPKIDHKAVRLAAIRRRQKQSGLKAMFGIKN